MLIDDAQYFTNRALNELRVASTSEDGDIARAHLELSDLLLERARNLVAVTIADTMPAIPLRLTIAG